MRGESREDAATAPLALAPPPSNHVQQPFLQLATLLAFALYILNLGYGFDGTFTKLRDFTFVSHALTGLKPGEPGNRFAESWLGALPLPVPKQYVRGIDLQKKDFEDYGQPSYLRGEWKDGGWWYYYIYGLAVKTPHGSQFMLLMSVFTLAYARWSRRKQSRAGRRERPDQRAVPPSPPGRGAGGEGRAIPDSQLSSLDSQPSSIVQPPSPIDLPVLLTPPIVLLVLVSSQLEFNHHVRYVLPVLGFVFVFSGVTARWFEPRPPQLSERPGTDRS